MRWWVLLLQVVAIGLLAFTSKIAAIQSPAWQFVLLAVGAIPGLALFAVTCSFGCCGQTSGGNDLYDVEVPVDENGEAMASAVLLPGHQTKHIQITNYALFLPMWISVIGVVGAVLLFRANQKA